MTITLRPGKPHAGSKCSSSPTCLDQQDWRNWSSEVALPIQALAPRDDARLQRLIGAATGRLERKGPRAVA